MKLLQISVTSDIILSDYRIIFKIDCFEVSAPLKADTVNNLPNRSVLEVRPADAFKKHFLKIQNWSHLKMVETFSKQNESLPAIGGHFSLADVPQNPTFFLQNWSVLKVILILV